MGEKKTYNAMFLFSPQNVESIFTNSSSANDEFIALDKSVFREAVKYKRIIT